MNTDLVCRILRPAVIPPFLKLWAPYKCALGVVAARGSAGMPAHLPACPPICLFACLPARLPASLPDWLRASLHAEARGWVLRRPGRPRAFKSNAGLTLSG
eukprot:GHVU01140747.1.p2 GENE.GHVU01140747.1~~GHVU01140747.1.p2  ORF type:complete len:101 (-),score=0.22 GHVU01140747.1:645-947(-)